MPWIQNTSLHSVLNGNHIPINSETILIRIIDPDMDFGETKYPFSEMHCFKFLDLESDSELDEFKITDKQANSLVEILNRALSNNKNVLVHCVAGVCRSGAVCEVGVMMGFTDTGAYRSPNTLVKNKLMRILGWTYEQ